jgi:glutaredoxin
MPVTMFSSAGCIRCGIVKNYLEDNGIGFAEHDITSPEGNSVFKAFYREHRSRIRRDAGGIFFPVVMDADGHITQDAGCTLARFMAGGDLSGMVEPNNLGHGWIGGLFLSRGGKEDTAPFLDVLRLLKKGGLATEATSDGRHGELLQAMLTESLVDRLLFHVPCPVPESPPEKSDLELSLKAAKAAQNRTELHFFLDVGKHGLVSPATAAESAKFMQETTGDNRLPLVISSGSDEDVNLFPYRTEARRWQVLADIAAR